MIAEASAEDVQQAVPPALEPEVHHQRPQGEAAAAQHHVVPVASEDGRQAIGDHRDADIALSWGKRS